MNADWNVSNELPKVVVLDGSLTIQRIGELKEIVALALAESGHVILNLAKGTEADLSFLQLICAAHKSASRDRKLLLLDADRPECLRQAMDDAGLLPLKGCRELSGHGCLWKGEER